MFNVRVTFCLSGLWHGAAFTYVIWGGLHGALQCVENLLFPKRKTAKAERKTEERKEYTGHGADRGKAMRRGPVWWVKVIVVFCLVAGAWCFFRAASVSQAFYVFAHMKDGMGHPASYILNGIRAFDTKTLKQMVIPVALLAVYDYAALDRDPLVTIGKLPSPVRKAVYYMFLLMVLLLASFNSQEFVYFQF